MSYFVSHSLSLFLYRRKSSRETFEGSSQLVASDQKVSSQRWTPKTKLQISSACIHLDFCRFFCASGSMFPLYQLPGLQLRADEMHENANSGCLTASQSTCYDLLFSLTDNCTISCTVWSSSSAAAPPMNLLYYFCFHPSSYMPDRQVRFISLPEMEEVWPESKWLPLAWIDRNQRC